MFEKISPIVIVKGMINIFHDSKGKTLKSDYFIFFDVPSIIAIIAFILVKSFNTDTVMALLTSFSIFVALLLNLLVVLFAVNKDVNTQKAQNKAEPYHFKDRIKYLKELHDSICFGILVSFTIVILLGIYSINFFPGSALNPIIILIIYYISTMFILTMLVVLKRMHILFGSTLDQ